MKTNNTFGLNTGNLTLKLLRIIGSPFTSEQEMPGTKEEALELYNYATKNKIGLLYLESLKNQDKLSDFVLDSEYKKELEKHNEQLITAIRASKLLNSIDCDYAIFKSIMPFPAIPNDVDIIHFGSDDEFDKTIKKFLCSGYKETASPKDYSYSFKHDFHDARKCEHLDLHGKDVYDLDLYHGITVSYIVYLDEVNFRKYVTKTKILNNEIKVLSSEADLVAIIVHSIIPEQLLTLFSYYATLYHLTKISIDDFISILRENNVTSPVKAHFSLVAELHQAAHGFVPEEIGDVLVELGDDVKERKNLIKNDFKMPHRYSLPVIIRTLLEKTKEDKFRRSAVKQTVNMLSNPKLAKRVISEVILRRKRETY